MSKVILLTFLFSFLSLISLSGNSEVKNSLFVASASSNVFEKNTKILNNKSIDINKKIISIIKNLEEIRPYVNNEEFTKLVTNVEEVILTPAKEIDAASIQMGFLIAQLNRQIYEGDNSYVNSWVFKASQDKVFSVLDVIYENKLCESKEKFCPKFNEVPFARGLISLIKVQKLIREEKYSQAKPMIEQILLDFEQKPDLSILPDSLVKKEDRDDWEGIKRAYLYIAYSIKLQLTKKTDSFDKAIKETQYLDENFYNVVDYFKRSEKYNEKSAYVYFKLRDIYLIDKYLGKHKEVIKKAKYLLAQLPEDSNNLDLLRGKSILLKDIGDEYISFKYPDLARRYFFEAWTIDQKTGATDAFGIGFRVADNIKNGNYDLAELDINSGEKPCNEYMEKIATAKNSTNCRDLINLFRKTIADLKSSNTDELRKEALKRYSLELGSFIEDAQFQQLALWPEEFKTSVSFNINQLNTFQTLHTVFFSAGEYPLASYYAKQFINTLQKLRSNLTANNQNEITNFTESHSFTLKQLSNTFYLVGDINAAWACLNIIKENQYLDYVRRRGVEDSFLTFIPITPYEKDFAAKIQSISYEIGLLNKQILSQASSSDSSHSKLLQESLDKAIKERKVLLSKFKKDLNQVYLENLNKKQALKFDFVDLKDGEAAIQYLIFPDALKILVATKNDNKQISIPFNLEKVSQDIINVNALISTNKLAGNDQIDSLSKFLIDEPFKYLSDKNIKLIKVQTDDALTMLPFSVLKFNNAEIGLIYTIENIRLANKSKKTPMMSVQKNDNLDAFGASKGNKEFSKLPSVKKEIDAVVNLDADKRFVKRTSFLDDKFNQINFFKSFKDGTSLVHISTHFKASGNQVNETKMLLGDGSTMSLEDIRNKLPQISSNLVTLSACNTGSVISSGTGKSYEGLSNVFQLKGAKNVISTLWEISDQGSADFMIIFYSLLFNNPITPSQALSYTQTIFRTGSSSFLPPNLALKQDKLTSSVMNHIKDYSNPYFWAAFQISAIN